MDWQKGRREGMSAGQAGCGKGWVALHQMHQLLIIWQKTNMRTEDASEWRGWKRKSGRFFFRQLIDHRCV